MVGFIAIDSRLTRARLLGTVILVLLILGLGGIAVAHEVGDTVVISEPVRGDFYAAGQSVDVRAFIDGDLGVAGRTVTVSEVVTGDVMAAGDSVTLAGDFRDDIRVAGRFLTLTGHVGDHALVAGETVVLTGSSHIVGFALIAGNVVDIGGRIGGDLSVVGETVTITGTVDGNVELDAATAVIGENAHIRGNLVWPRDQAPEIRAGARIDGQRIERAREGVATPREPTIVSVLGGIVVGAVSLVLLTWVLGAGMPPLMKGTNALLRQQPLRTFGIGLLALFAVPLAASLALITLIGAPIGVVLLLGYIVLLVLAAPVVLQATSDAVLERARRTGKPTPPSSGARLGTVAIMALIFVAITQVPIVGWLVGLVVVVFGLGALAMRALRRKDLTAVATEHIVAEPVHPTDHVPPPSETVIPPPGEG